MIDYVVVSDSYKKKLDLEHFLRFLIEIRVDGWGMVRTFARSLFGFLCESRSNLHLLCIETLTSNIHIVIGCTRACLSSPPPHSSLRDKYLDGKFKRVLF